MSTPWLIVLLTDFGTKDNYAASMKGVILTIAPDAKIIDFTHEVEPQNIKQGAFLLEATYSYFPAKSVFVTVVDPGVGGKREILAGRTKHGIFLAPDNGILAPVLEREKSYELRMVTNTKFFRREISHTFHGRDCFAPTAARLARSPSLFPSVGPEARDFIRLHVPTAQLKKGGIHGEILFFDRFGNAFTNISKKHLTTLGKTGCGVRMGGKSLGVIRNSYCEVKVGDPIVVVSSTGMVEIAVNQGSARDKLKLREGDTVEVF